MNKSEWMPENPYTYKTGYDDTSLSIGFREGSNTTAKAILEYLINNHRSSAYEDSPTGQKVSIYMLKSMLKQLEKE
jgi:hypothetical protein